jgi:hypothetical protein
VCEALGHGDVQVAFTLYYIILNLMWHEISVLTLATVAITDLDLIPYGTNVSGERAYIWRLDSGEIRSFETLVSCLIMQESTDIRLLHVSAFWVIFREIP